MGLATAPDALGDNLLHRLAVSLEHSHVRGVVNHHSDAQKRKHNNDDRHDQHVVTSVLNDNTVALQIPFPFRIYGHSGTKIMATVFQRRCDARGRR